MTWTGIQNRNVGHNSSMGLKIIVNLTSTSISQQWTIYWNNCSQIQGTERQRTHLHAHVSYELNGPSPVTPTRQSSQSRHNTALWHVFRKVLAVAAINDSSPVTAASCPHAHYVRNPELKYQYKKKMPLSAHRDFEDPKARTMRTLKKQIPPLLHHGQLQVPQVPLVVCFSNICCSVGPASRNRVPSSSNVENLY